MSHARQINKEIYNIKKELRNIQFHNQHMRLAACKLDALQGGKAKCLLFFTSLSIALWPIKKIVLNAIMFMHGNAAVTAATVGATTTTLTTATVIAASPILNHEKHAVKPTVTIEKTEVVPQVINKQIAPANSFTPKTATVIKLDGEQIIGLINHYTSDYIVIETKQGIATIEQKDIFKIMW